METKKFNVNAKRIKTLLKERGYSMEHVADTLGISASLVSGIVNGHPQRKLTVYALAQLFRVGVADILVVPPRSKRIMQ